METWQVAFLTRVERDDRRRRDRGRRTVRGFTHGDVRHDRTGMVDCRFPVFERHSDNRVSINDQANGGGQDFPVALFEAREARTEEKSG